MSPPKHMATLVYNRARKLIALLTVILPGAYTLIYFSPILLVAFVRAIYLSYSKRSKTMKPLKINPWNYPVFVRVPLALISLSELALLGAFVALFAWTTAKHLKIFLQDQYSIHDASQNERPHGSFLINVEHSIRYHIWIGHIMMVIWFMSISHNPKRYDAASVIFVNLPATSSLQWHSFTVTSCSGVEFDKLSILVKELFIQEGYRSISNENPSPHGHNIDYLHIYKMYLFVAGGSGIAPFLSIIKDLLHKVQTKQRTPLEKIFLVWAVRKLDELGILKTIFIQTLQIDIQAYVTRQDIGEKQQALDNGVYNEKLDIVKFAGRATTASVCAEPSPSQDISKVKKQVRGISRTQGYRLYAATILASFLGYMLLAGVIHRYYIFPQDEKTYKAFSRAGRGFSLLMEYVAGVVFFGGATILAWNWWKGKDLHLVDAPYVGSISTEVGLKPTNIQYGKHPEFQGELMNQT
ncbi:hypothetical protein SELMODRAFT_416972 [Selaginella moellendorffii]|uniref:FAD-binding FR-type domain-containing protein n=1 Tax=Selaginella moellendorffii TaxID=88036 RepID=D8S0Z1_SELML|nr:hypothetical protein SELMODRAFT_416972 [Selaginella moellendorffii]